MFTASRLRRELSVLVLLCTLGIFLFPGATGPYSAVHGPVTALLALRQALKAFWSIACSAVRRALLLPALLGRLMSSPSLAIRPVLARASTATVLRC